MSRPTPGRTAGSALAGLGLALLGGCYFDQLQRAEQGDIARVEGKQAELERERSRSDDLRQRERELADELSERELSLQELNARVAAINEANGRTLADNEDSRRSYLALESQVHDTNVELAELRRGGAAADDARRARIATLESRLKSQLDLLFH